MGFPELPLVKSRTASWSPPSFVMPSIEASILGGKAVKASNHKIIFFFKVGRIFSMNRILSSLGQGNPGYFSTNAPAVIILSRSACSMEELTASDPAVKFRLTGTLPESKTARFATRPPFPGVSTMPTRFFWVSFLIMRLSAAAAAKTLVKTSSVPSFPSKMVVFDP